MKSQIVFGKAAVGLIVNFVVVMQLTLFTSQNYHSELRVNDPYVQICFLIIFYNLKIHLKRIKHNLKKSKKTLQSPFLLPLIFHSQGQRHY